VCGLPADYADPVVNYRNFIVLGNDDTNDSGYFMDTEGAEELYMGESANPIANFHAWEGRDAVVHTLHTQGTLTLLPVMSQTAPLQKDHAVGNVRKVRKVDHSFSTKRRSFW
jgi:hypothetical protein